MKTSKQQYLFGLLLIGFSIYQWVMKDYMEFTLCALAGTGFICNGLTFEPKLEKYKKALVVIAWMLIIASAVFFLYIIQFKFLYSQK